MNADLHLVGVLAEAALEQAILRAVKRAQGLGVLPAYQDVYPGGGVASS